MNKKIIIFTLLVLIGLLLLLNFFKDRPAVRSLPNGSKIIYYRENSPFVAVNIFIKNAKKKEPLPGLTNFSLEMLLRGSEELSKGDLENFLESIGAEIGFEVTNDFALISGQVLKDNLKEYLGFIKYILLNANYNKKEISLLKNELLAQIKQNNEDPFYKALELNQAQLFSGHYYGLPALGTLDSLAKIDQAKLLSFKLIDNFSSAELIIVVNGSFSPVQIKPELTALSEIFKGQLKSERTANNFVFPSAEKIVNEGQETAIVIYNYFSPEAVSRQAPLYDLINSYLGSGLSSPLFKALREKNGIGYKVGAYQNKNLQASYSAVYVQTTVKDHKKIEAILDSVFAEPLNKEDLKKAKNYLLNNYYRQRQTLKSRGYLYGLNYFLKGQPNYNYAGSIEKISFKKFVKELRNLNKINLLVVR